jgi:hypothetical protein
MLKKTRTVGRVFVRGIDSGDLLCVMEPRDTVMRLRRYEVPGSNRTRPGEEDAGEQRVIAYCKKAHRKLSANSDELVIDSIYALRCALLALQYEDEGDEQKAAAQWGFARASLDDALSEHRGSASRVVPIYNKGAMASRLRAIR